VAQLRPVGGQPLRGYVQSGPSQEIAGITSITLPGSSFSFELFPPAQESLVLLNESLEPCPTADQRFVYYFDRVFCVASAGLLLLGYDQAHIGQSRNYHPVFGRQVVSGSNPPCRLDILSQLDELQKDLLSSFLLCWP
jgi:hypothetical protein